MYQFLFIFFVYAFLGWCTEVSYAALVTGRFVNRGFPVSYTHLTLPTICSV